MIRRAEFAVLAVKRAERATWSTELGVKRWEQAKLEVGGEGVGPRV